MATVAAKIYRHHKKTDGTYNVKIRIYHQKHKVYLNTCHFVTEQQLNAKFEIIDPPLKLLLDKTLAAYRQAISKLHQVLPFYTADDLASHLRKLDQEFDFVSFCNDYIKNLFQLGRTGSAKTLKTALLSIMDYFGRSQLSPLEITYKVLARYEQYLRQERNLSRMNQGRLVVQKRKGLGNAGVHNHLRDLRLLYKACMRFYNDPQSGDIKIPFCPFDNYKIARIPETRKRNLKLPELYLLKTCTLKPDSRAEQARDLFMLSFYLCGMNAVDIYQLTPENIIDGRLSYNRAKTKDRRKDAAFISLNIPDVAACILEKYIGQPIRRYHNTANFNRALNQGLKQISKQLNLPGLTFYWARHSFGTIARNQCRMTKDDVAMALNHIDNYHTTTDIYIEKDWTIIDDVQKAVIDRLSALSV